MWHTAMLSMGLLKPEYSLLTDGLRHNDSGQPFDSTYSKQGVSFTYYRGMDNSYNVSILVNFSKLIKEDEHVDLITDKETPQALASLREILQEYFQRVSRFQPFFTSDGFDLSFLKVKRIDYTTQISGLSQEEIDAYINCLYKGNYSKYPQIKAGKKQYNEQGNYIERYDGSFYRSNQSVTINVYDKRKQMENRNNPTRPKYRQDSVEKATGILRIEVQCHEEKVNAICKKYGIKQELGALLEPSISQDVIAYYLKTIAGSAPYLPSDVVLRKIEKSFYSRKTKQRMSQIIKDFGTQYTSLTKMQSSLSSDERKKFREALKKIEKLDCNPIPLPKSSKVRNLPNLLPLVAKNYPPASLS